MNTIELTSNVKTIATYSKDMKKRYSLRMIWNESKPKACIIMSQASTSTELILDTTSTLVRNNAIRLDYGSITIVNLFCGLDPNKQETDRTNSSIIADECSKADIVIVAYGRSSAHTERKQQLLEALSPYKDKLYNIIDTVGAPFSHPLSPRSRVWAVEKIKL